MVLYQEICIIKTQELINGRLWNTFCIWAPGMYGVYGATDPIFYKRLGIFMLKNKHYIFIKYKGGLLMKRIVGRELPGAMP